MSNRKKGAQKYQNSTKFRLNDDSKLTKRIKVTPLDLLCQRCYDQIKWKMDFKKYKPLTTPGKCRDCSKRTVIKAYRALCDPCSVKKIEVRVPKQEAETLGIATNGQTEGDDVSDQNAVVEEETKEVAE